MTLYNESQWGDRKREFAGIDKKTFALIRHLKKSKKDVNLFYIKIFINIIINGKHHGLFQQHMHTL